MTVQLFTDSSANLPDGLLERYQIRVIPLTLLAGGKETPCYTPGEPFQGEAFYATLRSATPPELKTSMVNTASFIDAFEPCVREGRDVLYIAMSSGISGTWSAGQAAAELLSQRYPQRQIRAVDTLAASLGEGLLVEEAALLLKNGASAHEAARSVARRREQMRQFFMVDDLMFLLRGGRISQGTARLGTVLNIKPILMGDHEGRIVVEKKIPGRRKALRTLCELFDQYHLDAPENRRAGIAHGGCPRDAEALAEAILQTHPEMDFTIVFYEPGTGAHVGPDTVALFFFGEAGQRGRTDHPLKTLQHKLAAEAELLREDLQQKLKRS